MEFTPEPGNVADSLDFAYRVASVAFADAKPLKIDLGGLSMFEAIGAFRAALRYLEDTILDYVECDELDVEDDDDD